MAIDNALPAFAREEQGGVLRFYDWSTDAVTFGYGQRHADVLRYTQSRGLPAATGCIVRRPSGGGIVDHRNDLTYAFALSADLPLSRLSPAKFYCLLHEALARALNTLSCPADLAPCARTATGSSHGGPAACFTDAPAPADVIAVDTRQKIAGAALRRSPDGVLAQGSIARRHLPPGLTAERLEPAFSGALCQSFGFSEAEAFAAWPENIPTEEDCLRFASAAWNRKR